MNTENIQKALDTILATNDKDQIKNLVSEIKKELFREFDELKNLLNSEHWPEAVMSFQICNEKSEEEKMDRAEGVIDLLINESLKDKKFLDFGCGEGHMAKYASTQETNVSVGYDINRPENSKFTWEQKENNFLLSTDLNKIKNEGPYDVIMIYDVLDHSQNPVQILKDAKSLLSDGGVIYVRLHPWCGRHGGHLYRQINKAFIHLVFTDEELSKMGYKVEFTNKVLLPILTYQKYLEDAGFGKVEPVIDTQDVEDFFHKNEIIKKRILNLFETDVWKAKEKPEWQMSQCFVDFILKK